MLIDNLLSLACDPGFFKLDIYDLHKEKMVFSGFAEDVPYELKYMEIMSIDCPVKDTLCINIDTSDN